MKIISQREARQLRKRVEELENERRMQRNRWRQDWEPGWVNIETIVLTEASFAKIKTARLLSHAVVIVPGNTPNTVLLYADKL